MYISGASNLRQLADGLSASLKMVFNASGALVFPSSEQHREQKASGISYEDDYLGNALAATLTHQQVEVRYHRDFSDAQVRAIVDSLSEHPEMSVIRDWRVTYQGRELPRRA